MLLSLIPRVAPEAHDVVDLGCGTGILAVLFARQHPGAAVRAVDESVAACRSAAATARRNNVAERVTVQQAAGLSGITARSVDLVLCNPPFHRGTTRDSDAAFAMFADAGRALRQSGELWTVYNSHLPYLPALRRLVGSTTVVGQSSSYTVTRSRVPAAR
jgi:16S rRNA (guanine1207-N2)-methyltransferase